MPTVPLPFFSDGLRLDADLHLPEGDSTGPYPIVVAASGYQGLKVIHPERFARALTTRGYAVLAFDYRGFGLSEGERGRLVPQEWVRDVRAAVDRVSCHPLLDAQRVALLGWGLGGGVVVAEASQVRRVRTLVCCNGIADGYRSTQKMHQVESWKLLLERVSADRGKRAVGGRSEITSPWDIVRLDLDGQTNGYVGDVLYRAPGFGSDVTLESADNLLRFHPEQQAAQLLDQPLLIVHGQNNQLHKVEETYALKEAAGDPTQLEILPGAGHTEWMFDEDPVFKHVIEVIDCFVAQSFAMSVSA